MAGDLLDDIVGHLHQHCPCRGRVGIADCVLSIHYLNLEHAFDPCPVHFGQALPVASPLDSLYYTGLSYKTLMENLLPAFTSGAAGSVQPPGVPETFKNLFGIFFPATAGIFAGASMSGDLKTPSKSIPQGTLRGLAVTFVLYSLVILSMGASIPREILHEDIKVIQTVSLHSVIIILGEFSTSLFSVIMGVVGAASMLNAIADDKIIPGLGIFTTTKKSKPQKKWAQVMAILVTWLIAQVFLFADINQIATFITMAFLMTFIVTNLACFLLKLGSAPNFRPSFKYFNSKTALMGVISCFVAMFIVDGISATLVIVFLFFLIMMIHYLTPPLKFGDISQLLIYHQVRKYLLRLKLQMSVKYWRPQILLLCDDPRSCWELIGFCNHLKKGGLYILGHVVIMADDTTTTQEGSKKIENTFSSASFKELQKQNEAWVKLRDLSKIKAFVQLALGPTLPWGVRNVYLGSGLGGMRPNITVIGFYDSKKHGVQLPIYKPKFDQLPTDSLRKERKVSINQWVQIIEDLIIMQATVAVAANFQRMELPTSENLPSFWQKQKYKIEDTDKEQIKYIDLYPIQMCSMDTLDNGKSVLSTNFDTYTLILQLGAILTTVGEWKYSFHKLRVIVFVETPEEIDDEKARLTGLLETLRIQADTKVICLNDGSLPIYNLLVKGYSRCATNESDFKKIDSCLQHDQWWKNLCSARSAMKDIERQKLKRKKHQQHQKQRDSGDVTPRDIKKRFDPLNLNNVSFSPQGIEDHRRSLSFNKRRNTISNLHDQGISLSLNMRSQGGLFFHEDAVESSDSETETEYDTESDLEQLTSSLYRSETANNSDSSESIYGNFTQLANITTPSNAPLTPKQSKIPTSPQESTVRRPPINRYPSEMRRQKSTKSDDPFKYNKSVTSDQISVRSSVSNLRPNFLSVKTPQAKINNDEGSDDDNMPSIRFVNDNEKDRNDIGSGDNDDASSEGGESTDGGDNEDSDSDNSKDKNTEEEGEAKGKVKRDSSVDPFSLLGTTVVTSTAKLPKQRGRAKDLRNDPSYAASRSPSLFSTKGEDIIQKLRTPKFRPDEDIDKDPTAQPGSLSLSCTTSPELSRSTKKAPSSHGPAGDDDEEDEDDKTITHKQLQEELKQLTFNDLPAKGQHLILNELMRLNSPAGKTDVIFSTLPSPPLGTHLNETESFEYTNNLSIWLNDLPPVLLVNSQTITVTTNL